MITPPREPGQGEGEAKDKTEIMNAAWVIEGRCLSDIPMWRQTSVKGRPKVGLMEE